MSIKLKEWGLFSILMILFLPAFGYVFHYIYSFGVNIGSYLRTLMILPMFM